MRDAMETFEVPPKTALQSVLITQNLKNFTVTKTLHKHAHEKSYVHMVLCIFSDYG